MISPQFSTPSLSLRLIICLGMPRAKMALRAFKMAFLREVVRVMDAAPWHESFRDNYFTIDREGAVTWHGDAAAGETLRAAVADVSFAAIARECGVVASWGILATFDGPGEHGLGGGTLVAFDKHGAVESVMMRTEDRAVFDKYM